MPITVNWKKFRDFSARYGTLIAGILITIGFMVFVPRFGSISNLTTLLIQISMLAIVSTGLTTVFAVGETDISTGAFVSLSGIFSAYLLNLGISPVLSIIISLSAGMILGVVNGVVVGYLHIPALLTTFATSVIALGLNYLIGNGVSIRISQEVSGRFFISLGQGRLAGVPIPVLIAVVVIILIFIFLDKTKWGLRMYSIGGNPEAAKVFGINIRQRKFFAYVICSLTASIAGLILASRLGAGSPIGGDTYTLDAIAAVFVGVSMFRNGEPHVPGTVIGVLIFGIIINGMRLLGVGYEMQIILRGIFILFAVSIAGNRAQFRIKLF
jgi:ribose/xylose/arabinose/galactoside ABC-type transport system permease subunit